MSAKWTKEEVEILIKNYANMSIRELQKLLPNRTYSAIKTRAYLLRMQGRLTSRQRPKVDTKQLINLWYTELTVAEIAEKLGIAEPTVINWARKLNLPDRRKLRSRYNEQRLMDFLVEHGGVCELAEEKKVVADCVISRLLLKKRIYKITFQVKGRHNKYKTKDLFKRPYVKKSFLCINRTCLLRLLFEAIKPPVNKYMRKVLTTYLKRFLTEAERIAVLWHLGIRNWRHDVVKPSIRINGILIPKNREGKNK